MAAASDRVSIDEVCRLLEKVKEWDDLGINLGLSENTIAEIRGISGGTDEHRILMISKWIQSGVEVTWDKLAAALSAVNHDALAAQIREQFSPCRPATTVSVAPSNASNETERILSTVDGKTFEEEDWNVVIMECSSLSAKWRQLSGYLGLLKKNIDIINDNHPKDSSICLCEALSQWIKQNYNTERFGSPSWRSLLKAVEVIDRRLFKQLASKHQLEGQGRPVIDSPEKSSQDQSGGDNVLSHEDQGPSVLSSPNVEKSSQGVLSHEGVEMVRKNEEVIKAHFTDLVLHVQCTLEASSKLENVRQFLTMFFKRDFSSCLDFEKLFSTVTLNDLWTYQHYSPLEMLTNKFLQGDRETEKLIEAYTASLSGFYMMTKLIDYIQFQQLSVDDSSEESHQPLNTEQFRKIKIVLDLKRRVSELSLNYVHKLWRSFTVEYDIPSLTVILDRIVSGSLEVTWRVLVELVVPRARFFRKEGIVVAFIDDVIIYDERQMAAKEKRLLDLCFKGTSNIEEFSSLLEQGVDPDIYDKDGRHPLWYSSYYGRRDLVELFLHYRATVDMTTNNEWGDTALIAAINQGHTDVVETLIQAGANINYRTKSGQSALWLASYYGHRDIVLLLLQHNVEVDLPNNDDRGETALFAASQEGRLEIATLLLNSGALVNCENKQGNTPLYFASQSNHTDVVELLLAGGADIDKVEHSNGQQSPLYVACQCGNMDTVKLLVQRGANVDRPCHDEVGATPLMTACHYNHPQVVQYLLDNGANINMQNKNNCESPLLVASQLGHTAVVKLLIQSQAQLEIKNKEGRTALMVASWRGHLKTVKELLRSNALPNSQDEVGLTSLILATQSGHTEVVKALLEANADPNITEKSAGWSGLFFAAKSGNVDIIKLLISKGAEIGIRDKAGLTAVEVSEDQDVRDELQRHTISQSETESGATEVAKETELEHPEEHEVQDQDGAKVAEETKLPEDQVKPELQGQGEHSKSKITKRQKKQALKQTYANLLRIFDVLEDSLLPNRKEKKLHQQRLLSSNIAETNQQLIDNN